MISIGILNSWFLVDSAVSEIENRHHLQVKENVKAWYIQKNDLHWWTHFNKVMIVWFHIREYGSTLYVAMTDDTEKKWSQIHFNCKWWAEISGKIIETSLNRCIPSVFMTNNIF